jgi:Protein of unknown function (DUF3551)
MSSIIPKTRIVPSSVWRTGLALGVIVLGAGLISCTDRERYSAPWCSDFNNAGPRECSYSTFEQCQAAVSGVGGQCSRNPSIPIGSTKPRKPAQRSQ